MSRKNIFIISAMCLLSFSLTAQIHTPNYEKYWKEVDSLAKGKGLTQSAITKVEQIYQSAKTEKNDAQIIKALIYKISLQSAYQENALKKNISELERELKSAEGASKSILSSILAEAYWSFFIQNFNRFYGRTQTVNFISGDIDTWTIDDFRRKTSGLYLSSIKNEQLLLQTKLEAFDAIIIKGNLRYTRPTLFDLLAHRALDYLKNDQSAFEEVAINFELTDPAIFSDKAVFVNFHFSVSDSSSLQLKAFQLFQRLILLHLKDQRPDALIDVDIERIQFAKQCGVMENRDELYKASLEQITREYGYESTAHQAWYLIAKQYFEKGNEYKPVSDTANRFAYLAAKEICEKIMEQKDSSEGKTNCHLLLKQIIQKELYFQTEKVNLPGQPFRAMVNYRNFTELYFRLIKLDASLKKIIGNENWNDEYWARLVKLPPFRTFSESLPETNDFQKHGAEIKIDPLPVGEWALIASVDPGFGTVKNPLAVDFFYVSAISYINNGLDYFVLNRETGQPLARANVQAWYPYYNNNQERYIDREGESFITDKNGFFSISPPKTNANNVLKLEFSTTNDHLFIDDKIPINLYRKDDDNDQALSKEKYEKANLRTYFFTDRAIYRPGQIVYFKGILITKDFDSKKSKILPGFSTRILLTDANEEDIDSLNVTTNEFGSFHGKFLLPAQLLNGGFKITDDSTGNEQSFSVEEYKRPSFYVEYDNLKGAYRLNDTIRITGSAKAFSGNLIYGAKGKYHIIRKTRFPNFWSYFRRGNLKNKSEEIAHGDLKTNPDGSFHISFPAIPDKSAGREFEPVFDYQVTTEITDISGETRTGETTVSVGYKALNISISLPEGDNLPADSFRFIKIRTENLSGVFEPADVTLLIYKLKPPDRLIRDRYWEQPDQFTMTKEEYIKNFPNDEYADEAKKETWEKSEKILEEADSIREDRKINFNQLIFKPGWYMIESRTKDKYGEEIKEQKYLQLYDSKSGKPVNPQYNWAYDQNKTVEPGDSATLDVGSSANNLFVIRQIEKNEITEKINRNPQQTNEYTFINLSNERKASGIPITEQDRGGLGVIYGFVKNNRFFTGGCTISVPWTNKELNISYGTYRDKTLPGSAEQWSVNISGYNKDKISAEVLSGMYDASLDQFKKQEWDLPELYDYYYNNLERWTTYSNFYTSPSFPKYINDFSPSPLYTYDRLLNPSKFFVSMNANGMLLRKSPSLQMLLTKNEAPEGLLVGKAAGVSIQPKILSERESKPAEFMDSGEGPPPVKTKQPVIQVRKNFNETAFFFPDLRADSLGNLSFSFTMPEAVTQWKWMTLAHTKDLAFGYAEKTIVTQKELMVQPNPPRFLREGDHLDFSVKIVNLSDSELTGQAELQLIDATTNQSVDGWFQNMQANQFFTVGSKQSAVLIFPIQVPFRFNGPLTYRIIAKAPLNSSAGKEYSDGEEATLPVLSNRLLITESMPINIDGQDKKGFRFESLIQSGNSETINNQSLTVEFTANPIWSAVQSLPYLMEYPYECAEQIFNRFYANALASGIVNHSPRIREIFKKWEVSDTTALLSNLQKNQDLKSVLLQETPWVMDAKNESQSRKNIALLFDSLGIKVKLEGALAKLQDMQSQTGSFAWFKNGSEDRYITQLIVTGFGHLEKLNAVPAALSDKINSMLKSAISYLDRALKSDYDNLLKNKADLNADHLGPLQIQYLYMRSFFPNYDLPGNSFSAMNYYRKQSQQFWQQQNKYMQGMTALSLFRTGDLQKAKDILASLKQNAISNEELGMYWKDITGGYYWQQAPVESQSLLIEAFQEIGKDAKTVDALKTWLLKQKQTENWKTTKSTADACYALLLQGTDLSDAESNVELHLGNTTISSEDINTEGGTGYFKKTIDAPFITPDMGNITVTIKPQTGTGKEKHSWGSVYWKYFEDMDKIKPASAALQVDKILFVEKNTEKGLVLEPVSENGNLKTGDKVRVRIVLKVDRDMEYVHLKDMRASCLEPIDVLSEFKWQGGLGYYESTKDASTNFFFSWLPKGTYQFEYKLFVTNNGSFSNGIANIQCMYAPEFTAHSKSQRLNVHDSE
jgi:hypothetical protein